MYKMTNSADRDQLASEMDLHCLQRQGISRFSRTRVIVDMHVSAVSTFRKNTTIKMDGNLIFCVVFFFLFSD